MEEGHLTVVGIDGRGDDPGVALFIKKIKQVRQAQTFCVFYFFYEDLQQELHQVTVSVKKLFIQMSKAVTHILKVAPVTCVYVGEMKHHGRPMAMGGMRMGHNKRPNPSS